MSTATELAVQLDEALSTAQPNAPAISACVQQLRDALSAPWGRQEFADMYFDLMPSIVRASGLSAACEVAAKELLAAAAGTCPARESFTLLAEALSTALGQEAPPQLHGPTNPTFQLFLLHQLAHTLTRIRRKWVPFLADFLALLQLWCSCTLPDLPTANDSTAAPTAGDALQALCAAWTTAASPLNQGSTSEATLLLNEEVPLARALLCRAALQLAAAAVHHPTCWQASPAVVAACRQAENTMAMKLKCLQGVVAAALSDTCTVVQLLQQLDITGVAQAVQVASGSSSDETSLDACQALAPPQEEGLAVALCCSLLADDATTGQQPCRLQPPADPEQLLDKLGAALWALTDMAAQHESVVLALLPLVATVHAAQRLSGANAAGDEGGVVEAAAGVVAPLVEVMSYNPVELVRACAHEALHLLLDALDPHTRLQELQRMLTMPSSAAGVVALQRLRMEIAPRQSQPPFSPQAVLEVAAPWLRQGGGPPGWSSESDVMQQSDVMCAALGLYRFAILQQLAARCMPGGPAAEVEAPPLLCPPALQALLSRDLAPLQACTGRLLQACKAAHAAGGEGGGGQVSPQLESFLALLRLEEVLEATVMNAQELCRLHSGGGGAP